MHTIASNVCGFELCINGCVVKISELSQVEQRNKDLIALSLYSLYSHVMRNPLKRMQQSRKRFTHDIRI